MSIPIENLTREEYFAHVLKDLKLKRKENLEKKRLLRLTRERQTNKDFEQAVEKPFTLKGIKRILFAKNFEWSDYIHSAFESDLEEKVKKTANFSLSLLYQKAISYDGPETEAETPVLSDKVSSPEEQERSKKELRRRREKTWGQKMGKKLGQKAALRLLSGPAKQTLPAKLKAAMNVLKAAKTAIKIAKWASRIRKLILAIRAGGLVAGIFSLGTAFIISLIVSFLLEGVLWVIERYPELGISILEKFYPSLFPAIAMALLSLALGFIFVFKEFIDFFSSLAGAKEKGRPEE